MNIADALGLSDEGESFEVPLLGKRDYEAAIDLNTSLLSNIN